MSSWCVQRVGGHPPPVAGTRPRRPRRVAARPSRRQRDRRPPPRRRVAVRQARRDRAAALRGQPHRGAFPGEHGQVRYGEGLLIGYRWYDAHHLPVAYPFGHGLSYTTFNQAELTTEVHDAGADSAVEVSLTVTNTGAPAGAETVQVYVRDAEASVFRPSRSSRRSSRFRWSPATAPACDYGCTPEPSPSGTHPCAGG